MTAPLDPAVARAKAEEILQRARAEEREVCALELEREARVWVARGSSRYYKLLKEMAARIRKGGARCA